MSPQEFFSSDDLARITDDWTLKAGGLLSLSLHDKGLLPDIDRARMERALDDVGREMEGYLERYNAALIQAGEETKNMDRFMAEIMGDRLVKMAP